MVWYVGMHREEGKDKKRLTNLLELNDAHTCW